VVAEKPKKSRLNLKIEQTMKNINLKPFCASLMLIFSILNFNAQAILLENLESTAALTTNLYDECSNSNNISLAFDGTIGDQNLIGPFTVVGATSSNNDPQVPDCFLDNTTQMQNSVWFSFTVPDINGDGSSIAYTISSNPAFCTTANPLPNGDTQFALYQGPNCPNQNSSANAYLTCNEDYANSPPWFSQITVDLLPGQMYHLLVDTWLGEQGEFCLTIDIGNPICGDSICALNEAYCSCPNDCACDLIDLLFVGFETAYGEFFLTNNTSDFILWNQAFMVNQFPDLNAQANKLYLPILGPTNSDCNGNYIDSIQITFDNGILMDELGQQIFNEDNIALDQILFFELNQQQLDLGLINIGYSTDNGLNEMCSNSIAVDLLTIYNSIYGCTDPFAVNYNISAIIDDGSCIYLTNDGDNNGIEDQFQVSIEQLQFKNGLDSFLVNGENSHIAHANFTFLSQDSILWGQIVVDGNWVVKNMPLYPVNGVGQDHTFTTQFYLGNQPGTLVDQVNLFASITPYQLDSFQMPLGLPEPVPVNSYIIRNGGSLTMADSIYIHNPDITSIPSNFDIPFFNFSWQFAFRHNMPNINCKYNHCAPAAVANSFECLKTRVGFPLTKTHQQTLDCLADCMMTTKANGTFLNKIVKGKNKFLCTETHYDPLLDQSVLLKKYITVLETGPFFDGKAFDPEKVFQWMRNGYDVELEYGYTTGGGHTVVVAGIVKCGDNYCVLVRSDNEQDLASYCEPGDPGKRDGGVDKWDLHCFKKNGDNTWSLTNTSANKVRGAIAQCPKNLPNLLDPLCALDWSTLTGKEYGDALYKTNGLISSVQTIDSGKIVEYISNSTIELLPNFEVQSDANFITHIDECD